MKRSITMILLAFCLAIPYKSFAEGEPEARSSSKKNCTMQGSVIDQTTGESLVGAQVELEGTTIKVYTDFDGNFEIGNLKPGNYNVIVSYISYQKSYIESISLHAEKEQNLSIELSR